MDHEVWENEGGRVVPEPDQTKTVEVKPTFDLMMNWEDGIISEEDTIDLFQRLVDNGMAWTLQGMYGRQAKALLEAGLIHFRQ